VTSADAVLGTYNVAETWGRRPRLPTLCDFDAERVVAQTKRLLAGAAESSPDGRERTTLDGRQAVLPAAAGQSSFLPATD
jgi:hypothetical protein